MLGPLQARPALPWRAVPACEEEEEGEEEEEEEEEAEAEAEAEDDDEKNSLCGPAGSPPSAPLAGGARVGGGAVRSDAGAPSPGRVVEQRRPRAPCAVRAESRATTPSCGEPPKSTRVGSAASDVNCG